MLFSKIQSNYKFLIRNFCSNKDFKVLLNSLKNKLNNNKEDELNIWENFKNDKELFKFQIIKTNFGKKFLEKVEENNLNDYIDVLKSFKKYFIYNKLNENLYLKISYGKLLIYLNENNCFNDELEKIFDDLDKNKILKHQDSYSFISLFSQVSEKHARKVIDLLKKNQLINLDQFLRFNIILSLYNFNLKDELSFFLLNYETKTKNFVNLLSDERINREDFLFIMKLLNEKNLYFDKSDLFLLKDMCIKHGLKFDIIKPTSSYCPECNTKISSISEEEIETLREYFLDKLKTNSIEISPNSKIQINSFLEFLNKNKNKFDIVIDGLNSSYQGKIGFKLLSKESKTFNLKVDNKFNGQNIVEILTFVKNENKFKNILVIGSKALTKHKNFLNFIQKNNIICKLFNADINDDLCIILAALYNSNCKLHTNDLFRDHHEKINNSEIKRLFYKLQNTKVISFRLRNIAYNELNEGWDKKVHMNSNYIHVPFKNDAQNFLFTWACCKINYS